MNSMVDPLYAAISEVEAVRLLFIKLYKLVSFDHPEKSHVSHTASSMMRFFVFSTVAALVAFASAQTTLTGAFDCMAAGNYTLCQNQWGASE